MTLFFRVKGNLYQKKTATLLKYSRFDMRLIGARFGTCGNLLC